MNILITGAGSGIGYDAALVLAQKNHTVFAIVKSTEDAGKFSDINNIRPVVCDITNEKQRKKLEKLEIDVLINNAAVGKSGPVSRVPLKEIKENYEVNVFGTVAVTQLFAPKFIEKNAGRIINVSSIAGRISLPYLGVYSSTKFALEALTDSLRRELQQFGIFVSLIEPGPIATGFNEKMIESKHAWLGDGNISLQEKSDMKRYHENLIAKQYSTKSVVEAIVDAVENPLPKIRYVAPKHYGFLMKIAQLVPDKVVDWFIRRM